MSTTETILEIVSALPREKQEQVLEFVDALARQAAASTKSGQPHPWIDAALKANLHGPPDWSEHLDDYLYGTKRNA